MRDPPRVLFVPVARTHWPHRAGRPTRSNEPVQLPTGAFEASSLFLHPTTAGAHYRVFAAVYHAGASPNSGHYKVFGSKDRARCMGQVASRFRTPPFCKVL